MIPEGLIVVKALRFESTAAYGDERREGKMLNGTQHLLSAVLLIFMRILIAPPFNLLEVWAARANDLPSRPPATRREMCE